MLVAVLLLMVDESGGAGLDGAANATAARVVAVVIAKALVVVATDRSCGVAVCV